MAKKREGVEHTTVSTNSAIKTSACIYYGCTVRNATTAGVHALIYDAKATAAGTLTDVARAAAGTNQVGGNYFPNGVIMHSGIYLSAVLCTSASDTIVVFYGGV